MAVAAALPAVATAQVEIWGVLDTGYQSAKQGSVKKNNTTSSGLTSSQLGFRGVEKIGNDMHAGFWFESQVWGDAPQAVIFSRRQTLDFGGAWGAIRLGRTTRQPSGTIRSSILMERLDQARAQTLLELDQTQLPLQEQIMAFPTSTGTRRTRLRPLGQEFMYRQPTRLARCKPHLQPVQLRALNTQG